MLEDPRIMTLNAVITACREAADQYDTAASTAAEAGMARRFERCARERNRFADELEASVRRMGGLPKEPDPEKLGLEKLWIRLKAALSENNQTALAEEVGKIEAELNRTVNDALHKDLHEAAAATLKALAEEVARTREAFEAGREG